LCKTNKHKPKQLKTTEIAGLREELAERNNQECPICHRKFSEKIRKTLDHDHDTYLIRNTICNSCNQVEGAIKGKLKRLGLWNDVDYSEYLRSMADHISNDQLPIIHPSHKPKHRKLQKRSYNELARVIKDMNKYLKRPIKIPEYPKSRRLTKRLKELFERYGVVPKFYVKG
jgi:hypothetical protein